MFGVVICWYTSDENDLQGVTASFSGCTTLHNFSGRDWSFHWNSPSLRVVDTSFNIHDTFVRFCYTVIWNLKWSCQQGNLLKSRHAHKRLRWDVAIQANVEYTWICCGGISACAGLCWECISVAFGTCFVGSVHSACNNFEWCFVLEVSGVSQQCLFAWVVASAYEQKQHHIHQMNLWLCMETADHFMGEINVMIHQRYIGVESCLLSRWHANMIAKLFVWLAYHCG